MDQLTASKWDVECSSAHPLQRRCSIAIATLTSCILIHVSFMFSLPFKPALDGCPACHDYTVSRKKCSQDAWIRTEGQKKHKGQRRTIGKSNPFALHFAKTHERLLTRKEDQQPVANELVVGASYKPDESKKSLRRKA